MMVSDGVASVDPVIVVVPFAFVVSAVVVVGALDLMLQSAAIALSVNTIEIEACVP